jgi:hypothetical protein
MKRTVTSSRANVAVETGIIKFLDFEGGFYGIVGDDGRRYDPENLDRSFRVDGLRVRFTVRVIQDRFSVHMWGTPVSIVSMQKLVQQETEEVARARVKLKKVHDRNP